MDTFVNYFSGEPRVDMSSFVVDAGRYGVPKLYRYKAFLPVHVLFKNKSYGFTAFVPVFVWLNYYDTEEHTFEWLEMLINIYPNIGTAVLITDFFADLVVEQHTDCVHDSDGEQLVKFITDPNIASVKGGLYDCMFDNCKSIMDDINNKVDDGTVTDDELEILMFCSYIVSRRK